ncbi:MAG: acyl--CoA ligase [Firmicutes bacterium]|nr:acyl--CoA ligase [Bacillota bacterium]
MEQKNLNMTGFASQDKPWLKYYTDEQISEIAPKMTVYECMHANNKDHLDDIAFEYYGNKITYRKLFSNIDRAQKSFEEMGIKKGDIVTICSITTPEIIYSFYALNKIGAISNMIDVRYTKQAIEEFLNEVESKYFITLDICYPKIEDILDKTKVEKTILVSPINSIPKLLKVGAKISDFVKGKKLSIPYSESIIDWNNFIYDKDITNVNSISFDENQPVAIVHTGGTTGIPKGVLLSNENFVNAAIQIKNSSVKADRNYKFLNIMPPFIAYGIVLGLNTPITLGWNTTVIPQFDANKFDELLMKHKPNGIMGVPAYWETVMKSKKMQTEDLSYIKNILLGGDRIKPEFEKRLNNFLLEHNCDAGVGKGYSMTEASACATFSTKEANELDSVGIPLTKTVISIFEPGTTKELPYNEVGEICIKTPTMMLKYFGKEEETNKVKVMHDDGYWIHSGDLGYINENGILFVKDRIKRMIIRSGFKVFPSEIENLFIKHPYVESCAVVGIPDEVDVTVPKACVVLKEEYRNQSEETQAQLLDMFENSTLPPYFKPIKFDFRDKLPLTDIGKVDFVSLQEEEKNKVLTLKRQ